MNEPFNRLDGLTVEDKRAMLAQLLQKKLAQPLSYGQQAMWFLYQLAPESAAYNVVFTARICSEADVAALRRALQALVDRHACLRSTFSTLAGEPSQQVHSRAVLSFEQIDARSFDDDALRAAVIASSRQPFDLEHGPVFRVHLFTRSATEHILLLAAHHIVLDGWSVWILLDELRVLYAAEIKGTAASLPPLQWQYADYVKWQAEMLRGPEGEQLWRYWQQQLSGELPTLNLPTDRPRPPLQTFRGASLDFSLSEDLSQRLKQLARTEQTTLYTLLMAAFQVLLHRYTQQEDFLIASPVTGRSRAEVVGVIGDFINMVVLRADFSGDPTFREHLGRARKTVLEALTHQEYSFPLIVTKLGLKPDASRSPLFQVAFDLQRPHRSGELAPLFSSRQQSSGVPFGGLLLEPYPIPQQEGQLDLVLQVMELDNSLHGVFRYNTDLFDASSIQRMLGHYRALLEGIVADPGQQVSALPLLTKAESLQLMGEWNATAADYPRGVALHHLVEAQAARTPRIPALVYEGVCLSYAELEARANQVARRLMREGVQPGEIVGVCMERSPELVAALLGVMKAGGAYVPLDPAYPRERLAFMLADSGARVLLTQPHLIASIPESTRTVVGLDRAWEAVAGEDPCRLEVSVGLNDLAYVIYTSGSTGKPKGALVEHRGLCNVAAAQQRMLNVGPGSRILQFSSLSFDASTFEIIMALCSGGTLYMGTPDSLMPGQALLQFLRDNGITIVTLPPSALMALPVESLPELHTITVAGETCPASLVSRWASGRRFFNLYGPTEATIWTTAAECTDVGTDQSPPIGRPIANTQVYILDRWLNPLPVGVPGELHIGGVGLARGYLNRPELTAQKFIPNPFSHEPGARLYKTGDLARYLPNGNIEFLGRLDYQVKVRGFRIELGEVDAVLAQHQGVREAVVVARSEQQADQQLVAYIVPQPSLSPTISELRDFLKAKLPGYMVPTAFVIMEALPLTPSGKVDRQALPAPSGERPVLAVEYAPPQTEVEHVIQAIWQEVLHLERVGVHDNFFDLGGHSLLVVRVHDKLRQAGYSHLAVADLFKYPTINALSQYLSNGHETQRPLSHAQERARRQQEALRRIAASKMR